ncbi:MAG TPA: ArsC/Spx/MgsR family protein [Bryobacteraceae bacterium]|nr:ArsC/Spx/MgsR family protein [Bryobacteraceae bacterium]
MLNVQIFGVKNSPATRAAERFFKERRISIQLVDLTKKPMAPGEIKRFIDRFGLDQLIDSEGAAYLDAGLKYLKMSEAELLQRVERDPKLLRLPLVRSANRLSIGRDEAGWKAMLADVKRTGPKL